MDGYHIRSGTVSVKINLVLKQEPRKPERNPKEFAIDVHLRRNSDGEVRVHRDEYGPHWEWQYSDGNYGCDCNRHLFFERAGGSDPHETGEDYDCGESAFTIVKVVRVDTGEVLSEVDPRGVYP